MALRGQHTMARYSSEEETENVAAKPCAARGTCRSLRPCKQATSHERNPRNRKTPPTLSLSLPHPRLACPISGTCQPNHPVLLAGGDRAGTYRAAAQGSAGSRHRRKKKRRMRKSVAAAAAAAGDCWNHQCRWEDKTEETLLTASDVACMHRPRQT